VTAPGDGVQAAVDAPDEATAAAAREKARRRRRARNEWLVLLALTVVGTFLIRTFVVQSYRIPSGSMERTLHGGCDPDCNNDRILVNKLAYKLHGIHHGDVVVFKAVDPRWEEVVGGPEDVVKRVIGLPGDTVQCCDAQGRVIRNGKSLTEKYVYNDGPDPKKRFGPIVVPAGQLFVMGDHRNDSSDSRYNGTIPESSVVGRAFMRIWPLSRLGFL
jgi:signal peptidase I